VRIDKQLNLIVPIYGDDGETVVANVHSTPLSREAVEQHFMLLAQTFSAVMHRGLGNAVGPAVAMRVLKDMAVKTGVWENDDKTPGEGQMLVAEIRRVTTVLVPSPDGKGPWQQVPLQVAVDRKILTEDDQAEVENAVAFFTAASSVLRRNERRGMLQEAAAFWGAQISSSSSTELATSLATSTGTVSSGEKPPAPAKEPSGSANATVEGKPASVPV
jgi:hypothetical protein